MRERTVLLTGGAGFIGSHVAEAYLNAGYDVAILDNLSTGRLENVPAGVRFIDADVRSSEARELLATGDFTVLNHHAAQIDVRRSVEDPVGDASVNVLGFLNLLEGARRGKVKRVVFASSGGAIYGGKAPLPVHESAKKLPNSPYGIAKLTSEYYLTAFSRLHGIEVVSLRYSNVYGPRQFTRGDACVVAIFAQRALRGEPLIVYGDGQQTLDMIQVGDVAAANVAATDCLLQPSTDLDTHAYNIGTGVETSVNHLAESVSEVAGRSCQTVHAPERRGEVRRSVLAIGKAAAQLAWCAQISLTQGLECTVQWAAQQRPLT